MASSSEIKVHRITRLFAAFAALIVEHHDYCMLIDTNITGAAKAIKAKLDQIGKPLHAILITHAHADHVGSLDALSDIFPQAKIIASQRTASIMAGDRSIIPAEEVAALRGGFMTTTTKPTQLVEDGEVIDGYRVIFTPGHAPGHLSFFHEATGTLFAGDALMSIGGLHVTGVWRTQFPFPYFATANKAHALQSARKLAALNPTSIHPIHGAPIYNPAIALSAAIDEAQERFTK